MNPYAWLESTFKSDSMLYPTLDEIVAVNKHVVKLTGDKHEYEEQDLERLRRTLERVRAEFEDLPPKDRASSKASLLMHRIAADQCFHEGNKRTALVVGPSLLETQWV